MPQPTACPPTDTAAVTAQRTSLSAAAKATVQAGTLLIFNKALVTAIADARLDRLHLKILTVIGEHINRLSAKAWPSRQKIAEAVDVEPRSVSNKLSELRRFGYLVADRERVPEANARRLTVYTFDIDNIRTKEGAARSLRAMTSKSKKVIGSVEPSSKVTQEDVPTSPPPVRRNSDEGTQEEGKWRSPSSIDFSANEMSGNSDREGAVPRPSPRLTELRRDAGLSPEGMAYAVEQGLTSRQAFEQFDRFCNYYWAKGERMADWSCAWRNWVRRAFQFGQVNRARTSGPASAADLERKAFGGAK